MAHVVELELAGRRLRLETGRVAKQADGAVWASYADTVVLATAVASQNAKPGVDFLPLTVDYQEKAYAAGKIPGGYFKREGRPSEKEVLTSRLIDRPLRPLFPDGYYNETQVIASVLSADKTGTSDVIGITAASAGAYWGARERRSDSSAATSRARVSRMARRARATSGEASSFTEPSASMAAAMRRERSRGGGSARSARSAGASCPARARSAAVACIASSARRSSARDGPSSAAPSTRSAWTTGARSATGSAAA